MVHKNRQVFWLKRHHSSCLPGFPVTFPEELLFYSGGTAWDFNPLPFSPVESFLFGFDRHPFFYLVFKLTITQNKTFVT